MLSWVEMHPREHGVREKNLSMRVLDINILRSFIKVEILN